MTERRAKVWDYIIIGAGSAGCALAHELVNHPSSPKVLMLEAGGTDRSPFIRMQSGAFRACLDHDWGYRAQPDPTRNGAVDRWWRGRVVGGCSTINSGIFVRGAAHDFERWGELCGESGKGRWSARTVMPIFRELETSDQSGRARGHCGPLHVRTVKRPHRTTTAFVEAARAAGYAFNDDYNDADQEGVAYAQLTQRGPWRCSAADAFLRPLAGRENFDLLLNAQVTKLHLERGRVVGVAFSRQGNVEYASGQEIVLCAGALNSPKILMLSGIGEAQELERHGVRVTLDLPGVGRNLRDHPLIKMIYEMSVPTYNLTHGMTQKIRFLAQLLKTGEGPIANVFESVAFLRTAAQLPAPDIQVHFVSMGYLAGPGGTYQLAPYPAVSIMINKSYPLSSGRVRLRGSDPDAAPLIECELFKNEADLDTLVSGVAMVREIMRQQPIASLVKAERIPGPELVATSAIRDFVRTHGQICNHAIGTCRMGIDPDAVVDPDLRVHGAHNLWVADASIMPELTSGNTSAACMMIGKKLAKHLLAAQRAADQYVAEEEPALLRVQSRAGA